jgi:hypothetical protein
MAQPPTDDLAELVKYLSPEERAELDKLLTAGSPVWQPMVNVADPSTLTPQAQALQSPADILFYGGAAGGGKTDLIIGAALTQHRKSLILRRESKQLRGIVQRVQELLKTRDGYNAQDGIWRLSGGRFIEFGHCQLPGDEIAFQGRPHDGLFFDEITHFLELQFRFLMGWLRTTEDGQRCRVVATGNPPTDSQGDWVLQYWGPWLDNQHPEPALPGELRWYAAIDGEDKPVEDGTPFMHRNELITPRSRTFIPSSVEDNPFLLSSGYKATLQACPSRCAAKC